MDETTPTGEKWDTNKPEIRQDSIWGTRPSATEIFTKGEFNTDPDTIKPERLIQLLREH